MLLNQSIIKYLLGSLFFILTSCAHVENTENTEIPIYENYITENKLEASDRITSFRFHGWRSLDNHHLILSTSFNKPYLITLKNYCSDLRFTHSIIVNNNGSLLHSKFDSISSTETPHIKCFIESIYKISKEQADQISALKKSKKQEANQEKKPT